MGHGCCQRSPEGDTIDTLAFAESSTGVCTQTAKSAQLASEIRSIIVHEAKVIGRVKPSSLPRVPLQVVKEEAKEKTGLLEDRGSLNLSGTYLRCPTNFKIEPLHFRREQKKESLEDKYTIESIIGKGSFGEVRKIKDKATGQYRAMKVMSKETCQKTDNFADEIEIIKKLVPFRHTSIGSPERGALL